MPVLDTYNKERGTLTGAGFSEIAKTEWTGKVALPYVTDFAYASTNSECRSDARAETQVGNYKCTKVLGNWMNNTSYSYWTLLPRSNNTISVAFVCRIDGSVVSNDVYVMQNLRPVVYLKSGVRITENTGSSATPYILELN